MKALLIIIMSFFFFYGIFSLFKGVKTAGQNSLISDNSSTVYNEKKVSVSLPSPKKDTVKKEQSVSTSILPSPVNKITEKPTEKIVQTLQVQIIKAVITFDDGLVPNSLTVKAGIPVRLEIDPKDDGEGCMSTIMIPGLYDEPILINAEEKIVMEFTPKRAGFYDITCAMGVPWGDIRVE